MPGAPRIRLCALLAAVALTLLPALALASTQAVNPPKTTTRAKYCTHPNDSFAGGRPYVGISDTYIPTEPAAQFNCALSRIAAAHLGYFRTPIGWYSIEHSPGVYDFSVEDTTVSMLAEHHIKLLPFFLGTPAFDTTLSSLTITGAQGLAPPTNLTDFAAFVRATVARYGPHGSFWVSHPELPYDPVTAWEVWNEPNLSLFWAPRPNVNAYVKLLKAAYVAIRRTDPSATVVSAGTPFLSVGGAQTWLVPLLRAGAARYMTTLGLHYYGATVPKLFQILRQARTDLDEHGGARISLLVTETAWAGGLPDVYRPSQAGARNQAASLFTAVAKQRHALNLSGVFWYAWQNVAVARPAAFYINNLGLTTSDGTPKLVLGTVSAWARRLDR